MNRHAVATEPPAHLKQIEIVNMEQAAELAALLPPDVDVAGLRDALNDRGTIYRHFLWCEDASRPAPIREELKQLEAKLAAARAALEGLSHRAERALNAAFVADGGELRALTDGIAYADGRMKRIEDAACRAHSSMPSGDGRPRSDNLRSLCSWLEAIYNDFAGGREAYDRERKTFTLNRAAWITRVVALIDPEVTEANLSTALRELRKPTQKTA
jgi:hypothetical protein